MSKQGEEGISWTDETWNPMRGCSHVSEGCRNCYAERIASRFSIPGYPYEGLAGGGKWTGKTALVEDHLADPLRWTRPRRVFVNSMSDLFHESVPDEWIDRIFAVMAFSPRHTFQVLTKRPERMMAYLKMVQDDDKDMERWNIAAWDIERRTEVEWPDWPLPNVWLGVSVEDQKAADERIPLLLQTPAAVRFVSCEPLLGPVRLDRVALPGGSFHNTLDGVRYFAPGIAPIEESIDWVICGGESGPGARPMHPDWARSLRDQCQEAGVPFHFKQWGEWCPATASFGVVGSVMPDDGKRFTWIGWDGARSNPSSIGLLAPVMAIARQGKKRAGRHLDGRIWDDFPEVGR